MMPATPDSSHATANNIRKAASHGALPNMFVVGAIIGEAAPPDKGAATGCGRYFLSSGLIRSSSSSNDIEP